MSAAPPARSALGALRPAALRALAAAAALALLYYAGLLAVMSARLGQLPNYASLYDAPGAYALIWRSTPSARDALQIIAAEPLFEVGHRMPEFGIAEWSLLVALKDLLPLLAGAALLAAFGRLRGAARAAGCPLSPGAAAAAASGAGALALCCAPLSWVVCCAAPSWTVALALLGVSIGAAQALGPFDSLFLAAGLALALLALALQARRLTAQPALAVRSGAAAGESARAPRSAA